MNFNCFFLVLQCDLNVLSRSVVSDSLGPHGLYPARLLCPWDFPGKNAGVGCHFLLQGIFLTRVKPVSLVSSTLAGIFLPLSHQGNCKVTMNF